MNRILSISQLIALSLLTSLSCFSSSDLKNEDSKDSDATSSSNQAKFTNTDLDLSNLDVFDSGVCNKARVPSIPTKSELLEMRHPGGAPNETHGADYRDGDSTNENY